MVGGAVTGNGNDSENYEGDPLEFRGVAPEAFLSESSGFLLNEAHVTNHSYGGIQHTYSSAGEDSRVQSGYNHVRAAGNEGCTGQYYHANHPYRPF